MGGGGFQILPGLTTLEIGGIVLKRDGVPSPQGQVDINQYQ